MLMPSLPTRESDPDVLGWELVRRFGVAAPRYTSYPTAPAWTAQGPETARQAAARARPGPVSVYVHVPFCERMCLYCGCNVVVAKSYDRAAAYVDTLLAELSSWGRLIGRRPLRQLHLGGGTPTFLQPADLERLVRAIFEAFPPLPDAELGVEIDPVATRLEHLTTLRGLGFNRASIGVQDFSFEVQTAVERHQSPEITRSRFAAARRLGFESINLDLMYGLPEQTPARVAASARAAAELGADRVALFGYAHVPWMKPHQKKLEQYALPSPQARWASLVAGRRELLGLGYLPIGFDHFARPGDELAHAARDGRLNRNFQGYTVLPDMDLVGLGASAISDVGGTYLQNDDRISTYTVAVKKEGLATVKGHVRHADDELRRRVITDILCRLRVEYDAVEQDLGVDVEAVLGADLSGLGELEAAGLVHREPRRLVVEERARPILRNVARAFDAYARTPAGVPAPRASAGV